jgi:phosphoribosylformylglycinamidine cyclo-ligase
MMKSAYAKAGVDIDLADKLKDGLKTKLKRAARPEVVGGVGAFGGLFALDQKKYREPVLVSSMDGVGTKLRVAVEMGVHDTVGQDLVNHCCNDIAVMGAEPLFFLDYIGTGKLEPKIFDEVIAGLVTACAAANVALVGGETAQMPGFYGDGEYDLVGTIIGCVDRSKILDGSRVKKGDALIALPSSGLHTNGYTLARRILFDQLGLNAASLVPELGGTVGAELLKVHVNYAPLLLKLAANLHGAVHITGGGFWGNIPRVVPEGLQARIRRGSWPVPAVFSFLQGKGKVPEREMFEVFNMGVGMILAVNAKVAEKVMQIAKVGGFESHVVGEIVDGQSQNVELVD